MNFGSAAPPNNLLSSSSSNPDEDYYGGGLGGGQGGGGDVEEEEEAKAANMGEHFYKGVDGLLSRPPPKFSFEENEEGKKRGEIERIGFGQVLLYSLLSKFFSQKFVNFFL